MSDCFCAKVGGRVKLYLVERSSIMRALSNYGGG